MDPITVVLLVSNLHLVTPSSILHACPAPISSYSAVLYDYYIILLITGL